MAAPAPVKRPPGVRWHVVLPKRLSDRCETYLSCINEDKARKGESEISKSDLVRHAIEYYLDDAVDNPEDNR